MTSFINDQYKMCSSFSDDYANAIMIADRYGLTSEVIYEMTINGLSPIEALYEWDLI